MGFSSWAGQRRNCMTFFGPSMTEKTVVGEGEENIGDFLVTVGGRGRAMHGGIPCFSRTRTRVGARRWALTEPKRGVRLLNPSDCTAGYALLNLSDRSIWLLTEPDRGIPSLLLLTEVD